MSARRGRGTEKSQENSSTATRESGSEVLARESSKDLVQSICLLNYGHNASKRQLSCCAKRFNEGLSLYREPQE